MEVKDSTPADIDKLRKEIENKYQLPSQRSILVHPTNSKGDKFDCRVVSLHYLLNYANKDTIKEKSFELYLFSEAFFEMLMRDYSYQIYRSLYSCLEVTDTSAEPSTTNNTEDNENKKEETTEAMITQTDANENEETTVPGLDLNPEDNEKKRKRTASQVREYSIGLKCMRSFLCRKMQHLNERNPLRKRQMNQNHHQQRLFKLVNEQFIRNYYSHSHFSIEIVVVIF